MNKIQWLQKGNIVYIPEDKKMFLDFNDGTMTLVWTKEAPGSNASINYDGNIYYYTDYNKVPTNTPYAKLRVKLPAKQDLVKRFISVATRNSPTNQKLVSKPILEQKKEAANKLRTSSSTGVGSSNIRLDINPSLDRIWSKAVSAAEKNSQKLLKTSNSKTNSQVTDWTDKFNKAISNLSTDLINWLKSQGIDMSTAKNMLKSLNDKFNTNLVLDNKWGNKSLTALNTILSLKPQNLSNDLNLIITIPANEYSLGANKEEEVVTPSLLVHSTPINIDMNRKDIRAILSHYGYNPYLDLTGALRKSLRKWLAGDKSLNISWIDKNSDMYKDWIAPYTYYEKKGGRLIPRNPVERFLKGKNLPTAPRAEDRYKNSVKGTRNYAWKKAESVKLEIEKHGTMNSSKPAEILRYVDSPGDTVYIEYPDIHPGPFRIMRQVPRTASTKRPLGDEYNILKRRFNTAWNLAK